MDIDLKSDLLMALMNLIEMENHARFSYLMTENENWLDELLLSFNIRQEIMQELEIEENSQNHCFNKHQLSATFRFFEVGDKYLRNNEKDKAIENYNRGMKLLDSFINRNKLNEKPSFLNKIFKK